MKKNFALLAFLLLHIISYSQNFQSDQGDYINFNSKEIKINIDDSSYKGKFQSFISKKDKKEYIIYNYFSRTIIVSLNTPIENITENTSAININAIKLIHSSDVKSVQKAIRKNGLKDLKGFILVYESLNCNLILENGNRVFTVKN